MALVCYSHLPCRICSQIVCIRRSVAIQYNHHGVVCQLLRQYRACVVDSVLWYIHGKPTMYSRVYTISYV